METTSETKTFKEVHAEIEQEALFLQRNHNVSQFKKKAEFLSSIGFTNSIATRLYAGIADNFDIVRDYQKRYHGQYKFILEPQLERVCEKYNLFVRDLELFLGDVPEKNVRDIMNFKVDVRDIEAFSMEYSLRGRLMNPLKEIPYKINDMDKSPFEFKLDDIASFASIYGPIRKSFLPLQIAAVKDLFHQEAFSKSEARIMRRPELPNKFQVELDPIVLLKVKGGYIIITVWGDEANDELVVNERNN